MTRLGVDLRILRHARTGFFRYAQGGLRSLAEHPPAAEIVLLASPGQDLGELDPGRWERVDCDAPLFDPRECEALRTAVRRNRLDAVWLPFSLFPGRVADRVMVTLHDLTPLLYAETIEDRYRPHYRASIDRSREADMVLANSEQIARSLRRTGLDRVEVVQPFTPFEGHRTGETASEEPRGERSEAFVLAVGSLEPRKDPLRLLAAWEHARARLGRPLPLVVVASHGWMEEPFHAALAASRWRDEVELVRAADDVDLVGRMRTCAVFLSVSRHEGFGFPVIEAAHAGAVVLSTPVPSLTEAGVDAESLVPDGADAPWIGDRLVSLLEDPASARRHAARLRSRLAAYYGNLPADRLGLACNRLLVDHTEGR